jgi:hypothetical protein
VPVDRVVIAKWDRTCLDQKSIKVKCRAREADEMSVSTDGYIFGIRNVLLIIIVPDKANRKASGCNSQGPNVHIPQ